MAIYYLGPQALEPTAECQPTGARREAGGDDRGSFKTLDLPQTENSICSCKLLIAMSSCFNTGNA